MKPGRNESCPCGSGKKYKNCHEEGQNNPFLTRGTIALIVPLALLFGFAIYASLKGPDPVETTKRVTPEATAPASNPAPGSTSSNAVAAPGSQQAFTPAPPPPGPAPAGQVWSVEHGHWHNAAPAGAGANGIQVSTQQISLTDEQIANLKRLDAMPQSSKAPVASANAPLAATARLSTPPVATPPGKVWSAEHGHFHDVEPASGVSGVRVLGQSVDTRTGAVSGPALKPGPQPPGPVPTGKVWSAKHGHWHDARPK